MVTNNIENEDRIHAAQVHSAYSNTAPGMTATAVAAFVVAGVLAGTGAVGWPLAIAFSLFMLMQIQARLLLIATYHRHQPPDHEWRAWARRFTVGEMVAGFGLGGFSLLLLTPHSLGMQLLLALFLCAVACSAMIAFGVLRPAIYFSILPVLSMPAAWMMAQNDRVHWVLALLLIGWLLTITWLARRQGAQFEESLRLRGGDGAVLDRERAFH